MAEPAIARLRQNGLQRFSRRGRRAVRVEFALHCVAHNLALFLWGKAGVFITVCFLNHHGAQWRIAALAVQWGHK
jgi:hypothetical protein